jgi:uncharacterized RDD family membrane protein YckC
VSFTRRPANLLFIRLKQSANLKKLHRSESVRSAKTPVNKICSQCGSVLAVGEKLCQFCECAETPLIEEKINTKAKMAPAVSHAQWRNELNQRLQAYRARRPKRHEAQTALPFEDDDPVLPTQNVAIDVEETRLPEKPPEQDDFAFSIAIGRIAQATEADPRVMIDVSVPPESDAPSSQVEAEALQPIENGLFPIASLDERRRALLIDAACLAFAYGGFLALFGSLGGHFTFSKLSATVYFFSFAFVYLQYFGLFTVFGGSTPGMMVTGIQVASFTGDVPTPRQYMLRALGYLLSAGTCFLGFLWVLWDEDGLTWHDRLSNTYLARIESFGEEDISHPVAAR